MIVDRAIVKGLVNSIVNGVIPAPSGEKRYFTETNTVQGSFLSFPPVTFGIGVDFAIQFDAVPENFRKVALGVSTGTVPRVRLESNGDIEIAIGTDLFFHTPTSQEQGKLNRYIIRKEGLNVSTSVNGVSAGLSTLSADASVTFDRNARVASFGVTEILMANIRVWTGGNENTGTLIRGMDIEGDYSPIDNTVIDSVSGQDGEFVNAATGDSVLYTKLPNGDWEDADGNILEVAY